ncbi:angiopoietin-related protein 2-like [Oratosquilla oratoria]|uniref:angiopoietin-related protein 2-like n=1 Tax=Oratosquilla oratoria TaxID=337810 RepID=UPI003F76F034
MTLDIQQLSSSVQELQNTAEILPLQALLHALQNLTQFPSKSLVPKTEIREFGDVEDEHWLGLENLHHLTSHSLQELRIDLAYFDNATRWAKYGFFNVKDSDSKYVMNCGRYTGNAADSLSGHSGHKFSTQDNDNDAYTVPCGGQKLSRASASSLLELAGFAPSCVSRALAQCYEDSNPQALQQSPLFALAIHNITLDIQHLSRSVQELQNTTEILHLQALLHILQNLTQSPPQSLTSKKEPSRPRHCLDLKEAGDSGRGVKRIYPFPCCPNWVLKVFCDQETGGGGWTVVQRRDDLPPYEDFYRTYIEYERSFRDVEGEHWLGLENIHHLTSHSLQELHIDLADFDNATRWANYGFFHVRDSDSKYIMNCGRYTGDAGDSLSVHSGQKFSTYDNDNDAYTGNCAEGHINITKSSTWRLNE